MEAKGNLPSGAGRPPIGPKVQTAAPPEVAEFIEREAKRRGVRPSVIAREVLVAGHAVLAAA